MKTLYLDCGMGAAGDMLSAALLELLPNPDEFIKEINAAGIPGVKVTRENAVKCGITGTHVKVLVGDAEEDEHLHDHHHHHDHAHDHAHTHEHEHDHSHSHAHHDAHEHVHEAHHHSGMHEIEHIISHLHIPEKVRKDVISVYSLIAEAESHAHGVPVSQIHFHEVGTMDAVADITACCLLINKLSPDKIIASPVHVGSGQVKCAHGILPVPAPATAYILKDVPIYGGSIKSELCTPTGAALLRHFADDFGHMPAMKTTAVGYGMGKKDFEAANCVRAILGESAAPDNAAGSTDTVSCLACNVDDMTAEDIGFAMETLLENGALEVFTLPCVMKKSRPGTVINVLCKEDKKDEIIKLIFKHTTTIGIRETLNQRYVLDRTVTTTDTPYGEIRTKTSSGYGVTRSKFEYDDLARIAKEKNISLDEIRKLLENK